MSFQENVYRVVKSIPRGYVMTYGQVALYAGNPSAARAVGYVLSKLPMNTDVPWQRVVNHKGMLSIRNPYLTRDVQQSILESEGIQFNDHKQIDLSLYRHILE